MPKRSGCQIGCLFFAVLFIALAWALWSLAVGKYEVLSSFADDSSGMENAFPDFPTKGPIACRTYVLRFGVRVLAGRVDPAAFDAWAKKHYPPRWETWQADSDEAYDVWFKDGALLKRVGLPHLFQRSGDTMTAFARSSKRLYHSLEVNITQGTFLYIDSFTDGDGEEE
jgi:hypothetical protein